MFPITLLHALIEGREVSLEDRKQICKETGGTFTSSLEVSACQSGDAVLSPAADSGLPTQYQSCDRGNGYTYSNVCVYNDADGSYYWDDGPSIPGTANNTLPGSVYYNYIVLFWPAGQWHDYCYHHGQITYGYDKNECDSRFYSLIFSLCTEDTKLSNKLSWYYAANCVQAAQLAREAVEKFGDSAFSYVSTVVYFEGKYSSPTNSTNENVSPAIININIINDLLD
jgi:hypothetical protein